MPVIIPVSLDVQTAEVLDARTTGHSTDTDSLSFKAPGPYDMKQIMTNGNITTD